MDEFIEIQNENAKIKLGEISPSIGSRDLIKELVATAKRKGANRIIFDFSGVSFISWGASHEIMAQAGTHNIKVINMNNFCRKMFDTVYRRTGVLKQMQYASMFNL